MKKGLLLLLLAISALSSFALNKYELLLGLRGGAGALFYQYRVGDATFPNTQKQIGVSIPAKGEVLFGLRGFRFGYRFEYHHNICTRYREDYDANAIPDFDTMATTKRNIYAHLFVLEIAIPASQRFAITPSFAVGGFRGWRENWVNKRYYKDVLRSRFVIQVGLGFEFTKGRFSFTLAPVYSYYHLKDKTSNEEKGAFHNLTLDLVFRLNLLKPQAMR